MLIPDDIDDAQNVCLLLPELNMLRVAEVISEVRQEPIDHLALPGQVRAAAEMDRNLVLIGRLAAKLRSSSREEPAF